jgi:methionine-S-sulfoxide reductase
VHLTRDARSVSYYRIIYNYPYRMSYTRDMETAIFAAGCFWGVQFYFDQVPGVKSTIVGYTGGNVPNPTYEQVCTDTSGHAEAVQITFDPQKVQYETLVRHFFRLHNPTQLNRQGPDVGTQYRSAIFYTNDQQRAAANHIREELQPEYSQPIVTEITQAGPFYEAEAYHQKYAERTGHGMCHVRYKPL